VRMSKAELAAVDTAARAKGLSIAAYIRMVVLERLNPPKEN